MARSCSLIVALVLLVSPLWAGVPAPAGSGDLDVGGSKIHYEVYGDGPAVVLIHDGLLSSVVWDAQIADLASEYRVIRYDRRGFGRSGQPTEPFSNENDLGALLDHLQVERAVLIGSSSGGGLAVDYTLDHPQQVSALVLVGAVVNGLGYSAHFIGRNQAVFGSHDEGLIDRCVADPYLVAPANTAAKQRLRELLENHSNDLDQTKYRLIREYESEHGPRPFAVRRLSEIRVPTLLVTAAEDIPDVHVHAGAMEAGIAGACRVVIPDAGHLVYLEQPEIFNRTVLGFLARLSLQLDALPGFERGFVDVGDAYLYYEALGSGHPLVLIHGGLLDHRMWDDQMEALAQHFRVIRYDVRGNGLSHNLATRYWSYQDLARLLDELGHAEAHLMGLSMGGRIAVDLALAEPERVSALITVSTGISGWQFEGEDLEENREGLRTAWRAGDLDQVVEYFQRSWTDGHRSPDEVDPRVRERVRQMAWDNVQPGGSVGSSRELEPPAVGRLSEITAPTLIVLGQLDMTDIHTISDQLATEVPGAKKVELPGVAHVLNMEKPAELNSIVLEFLQGLEGQGMGDGE